MGSESDGLVCEEKVWVASTVPMEQETSKTAFVGDEDIYRKIRTEAELKRASSGIGKDVAQRYDLEVSIDPGWQFLMEEAKLARCLRVRFYCPHVAEGQAHLFGEPDRKEKVSKAFWERLERIHSLMADFAQKANEGKEPQFTLKAKYPGDVACQHEEEVKHLQRLQGALAKDARKDIEAIEIHGDERASVRFDPKTVPEPFRWEAEVVQRTGIPHCLCEKGSQLTGKLKGGNIGEYYFDQEFLEVLSEAQFKRKSLTLVLARTVSSDGKETFKVKNVEDYSLL